MLKIVGGEFRGRKLRFIEMPGVRPTTSKVREAVFDILHARRPLDGVRFLDLFAGTGAVGLEALSRGAAYAEFVESDRAALACLESNIAALGVADRCRVTRGSSPETADFDIVFADPPYKTAPDFAVVARVTRAGGFFLYECNREEPPNHDGFSAIKSYHYGKTHLHLLRKGESA